MRLTVVKAKEYGWIVVDDLNSLLFASGYWFEVRNYLSQQFDPSPAILHSNNLPPF